MPIPKTKEELLEALQREFAKLLEEIKSFPLDQANKNSFEGHKKDSFMNFNNLLSHLLGWGLLVLKWNDTIQAGNDVDWPEKGFKWTELGELAQKFYEDHSNMSTTELINELVKNHGDILEVVQSSTNEDLYHNQWYKHYPMGRMIQLNTSSPYKNAYTRIRKWKKSNS